MTSQHDEVGSLHCELWKAWDERDEARDEVFNLKTTVRDLETQVQQLRAEFAQHQDTATKLNDRNAELERLLTEERSIAAARKASEQSKHCQFEEQCGVPITDASGIILQYRAQIEHVNESLRELRQKLENARHSEKLAMDRRARTVEKLRNAEDTIQILESQLKRKENNRPIEEQLGKKRDRSDDEGEAGPANVKHRKAP